MNVATRLHRVDDRPPVDLAGHLRTLPLKPDERVHREVAQLDRVLQRVVKDLAALAENGRRRWSAVEPHAHRVENDAEETGIGQQHLEVRPDPARRAPG